MTEFETPEVECIDARTVRALTDLLAVYEECPGLFVVAGEGGNTYRVDAETGACTCPDAEYRQPDGGCKHARRVALWRGETTVPEWADTDALDPLLAEQLADVDSTVNVSDSESERSPATTPTEKCVATDGGVIVAGDEGEILDSDGSDDTEKAYSEHVEPRTQGGRRYVRCESCSRELLVSLGGRDALPHKEGCPNA